MRPVMTARRLQRTRWGLLTLAIVVAAVGTWWFLAPAALTPAEHAMLGTWAMERIRNELQPARLTFNSDHSVIQTIDNGPNAAPTEHQFYWWVEGDRLVFDEYNDSLVHRATRLLRPQDKVVLISVTRNAATVRTSDGRIETWTRVPASGESPDTAK